MLVCGAILSFRIVRFACHQLPKVVLKCILLCMTIHPFTHVYVKLCACMGDQKVVANGAKDDGDVPFNNGAPQGASGANA